MRLEGVFISIFTSDWSILKVKTGELWMRYPCSCAEGVSLIGCHWVAMGREAENRRSTAVQVSDRLVEGHILVFSFARTRGKICVLYPLFKKLEIFQSRKICELSDTDSINSQV